MNPNVPTGSSHRQVYADDIEVGDQVTLGEHRVTEDEIVCFAKQWDPLRIHVDRDAVAKGIFGGLIASGLHTMGVFQRLAVAGLYCNWAVVAGRSLQARFTKPVLPDTTLSGTVRVLDRRTPRHGRCLVVLEGRLTDDLGDQVLLVTVETLIAVRGAHDGAGQAFGS